MDLFDINTWALSGVCTTETWALWLLFLSSFLAATLLPGGSEIVLFGIIRCHPDLMAESLLIATIGNTLGGMTSYLIGRFFKSPESFKYIDTVRKYGAISLILAWAPIIGDILCVTAGWLRICWFWSMIWMTIGKFARYWLVVSVAQAL